MNLKAVGMVSLVLLGLYCEVTGFGHSRINHLSIYSETLPKKAINVSPEGIDQEIYHRFFMPRTQFSFGEQPKEGLESDVE